ncbi:PREDICTED: protein FAM65C isoform X2 [Pseudopodoces humilis]|uniref:protein FAM65C isoform X2 n=1 Tax=Pseudopodoces humilis TaxID=181119 RepID=UPI0006B7130F|nr:PREDICTED: protein FAM65C isoform X2 [Pseudopodoces humilis]
MSVKLTFVSPGDGAGISRSCSFTGFSTVQSRKAAKSLSRSSVRSRMSLKSPKAYNSLQKGALIWDPKPLQVKKIFEALKKGLNEYLEAHQAELDYLSGRHKDTKRNSRLAFYYDLDKQIRSVERYIRKLEFHISKVEELYEAYCIQCRLRDGATNMKHAFSLSPSTKASRESLVELYKNVQECTEVTELRGLATILVGVVTCDSINFFSTKPQAIVVDITELGTIKLRLEVLWNPFDTENLFLSPGSTAKFSVGSRKSSLYNWTPPNTPSFRERYYLSVLQQRQSPGDGGEESQPPSILSYLAACDFDVPGRNKPHNPVETSEGDSLSSEDQKGAESRSTTPALDHRMLPLVIIRETGGEELQHPLADHSTLDILKKTPCAGGFPSPSTFPTRHKGRTDSFGQARNRRLAEQENISQKSWNVAGDLKADGRAKSIDRTLQEVLNLLKWRDEGQAQLEKLECQVSSLRDKLKLKTLHKHSSMESLMVETVLESFDFLNADCSADELSLFGSVRTGSVSTYNGNVLQSLSCDTRPEARDVTTGDDNLDTLLITHLRLCKGLLQKLRTPNVAQVVQESILEEVSEQTRVLGDVLDLSVEKIIQKTKKKKQYLKIWSDLAEPGSSILVTSAERFRHALKYTMMLKVKEKYPSHLETVLQRLLEQILTCDGLLPSSHFQTEPVTLFQFYRYLERHRIGSLEKHLAKLAKEAMLIEELQCPGRLKTLKRLKGKRLSRLQPLPRTLRLLGLLQLDQNHRVSKAATACLARASGSSSLRARAVLFYTDVLSDCDTRLQQAACLALKNLRAVESIEQVAHLCQSETEEVRNAARETTLSFGERGRQAFEKMDRICCELRETAQEAEIEITVF